MSKTAAMSFMDKVRGDAAIQSALADSVAAAKDPIAATCEYARARGFEVEPGDLRIVPQRSEELGDGELDAVSGGTFAGLSSRGIIIIDAYSGLGGGGSEKGIIIIDT